MAAQTLVSKLRSSVAALSVTYNVGRRWSKPVVPPASPDPLPQVPLYCIINTWYEADVIGATVHNAFAQGCERVFLVDNDSGDGTVAEATAAGAELATVYRTDRYDESRRLTEIRAVMQNVSEKQGSDHVWWLVCDADEFPHGPDGLTIRDYLSRLDRRFRVVGARVFNHYPSSEPAYRPGHHPLDYQPLCQEVLVAWCALRHWKHPLLRYDRRGAPLWPGTGFHRLAPSAERVTEPTTAIFLHHFQYRERTTTFQRLQRLYTPGADGVPREAGGERSPSFHRLRALEDVYSGRWASVPVPSVTYPKHGVQLKPWEALVSPAEAFVRRWYPYEAQADKDRATPLGNTK